MDKKRNEIIANKIMDFLTEKELSGSVRIYFNNICYDWSPDGKTYKILNNIKASDYFEGAKDELVNMTFEGIFYDVINRYIGSFLADEFDEFLEKEGLSYEFYNSWNLTICEI